MKKLVAVLLGLIIASVFATTVSADEYKVQKGDTLWEIAKVHNTTVKTLMENNNLNSSLIFPEQVLTIDENEVEYYEVEKGDTLSKISKTIGEDVTVSNLREWNNLSSDLILVGQELAVNGPVNTVSSEPKNQDKQDQIAESDKSSESKTVSVASAEVKEDDANVENESKVESKTTEEETSTEQQTQPEGKTFTVEATAYTAYCNGCSGITATGINLKDNPNAKVIAVDPNVIPLGSKVYVEGYGQAIAGDTGGAIKGNKIDIHVPTKDEAYNWGRRSVQVTIVE
ncbi:LysM peptidoglycan-binding and 3D domain-containing protein [Oceanobacillus halophilus]|uniref:LysM peptidoglycan-binding domain-containing protein n=1 Tax=Oceanobacillus halophilus TaxID=930130 RepID=A0A495ADG2_9BACI|nr:3D domain-containing protein [Oceanobacillus halophilus]RKQ37956.1 LysM peptidoglycan-binding domain-containing protein [Oceanobacillus halophilus]